MIQVFQFSFSFLMKLATLRQVVIAKFFLVRGQVEASKIQQLFYEERSARN